MCVEVAVSGAREADALFELQTSEGPREKRLLCQEDTVLVNILRVATLRREFVLSDRGGGQGCRVADVC